MKKVKHLFNIGDILRHTIKKYESGNLQRILLRVILPVIILGLIVWHVLSWNINGIYYEMLQWHDGSAYEAAIYNLVLIVSTGVILSILMKELTNAAINGMQIIITISKKRKGTS
jgi:hypothetical protein